MLFRKLKIDDVYFPCHQVTTHSAEALTRFLKRLKERGHKRLPSSVSDCYLHGYNDACAPEKDLLLQRLTQGLRIAKGYMDRSGAQIPSHYPEIAGALEQAREMGL